MRNINEGDDTGRNDVLAGLTADMGAGAWGTVVVLVRFVIGIADTMLEAAATRLLESGRLGPIPSTAICVGDGFVKMQNELQRLK